MAVLVTLLLVVTAILGFHLSRLTGEFKKVKGQLAKREAEIDVLKMKESREQVSFVLADIDAWDVSNPDFTPSEESINKLKNILNLLSVGRSTESPTYSKTKALIFLKLTSSGLPNGRLNGLMRKLDFRFSLLTNMTFNDLNLSGVNLSSSNLYRSRLNNCNLSHINLDGTNLTEAQIDRTDLTSASLKNVTSQSANFDSCNLKGSYLNGGRFVGSKFTNCLFSLGGALYVDFSNSEFRECNADSTYFSRTNLSNSRFEETSFIGTRFYSGDWSNIIFDDCVISKSLLAKLPESKIEGFDKFLSTHLMNEKVQNLDTLITLVYRE